MADVFCGACFSVQSHDILDTLLRDILDTLNRPSGSCWSGDGVEEDGN